MTDTWPFPFLFERKKYREAYLVSQVTEAQVQKDIIEFLQLFKVDVVPIDAGGRRQRGRMIASAKSKGIHVAGNMNLGAEIPRGFADLEGTLAPTGRSLYIEVKAPAWIGHKNKIIRPAGKPSQEQLAFLYSKHLRGAVVLVAWSVGNVQDYLGSALDLNRKALG